MISKKAKVFQKFVGRISQGLGFNALNFLFLNIFANHTDFGNMIYVLMREGFSGFNSLLGKLKKILPKTTKSNPLSKLFRPWFEHHNIRGVFGASLIALLILAGILGTPATAKSDFVSASSGVSINSHDFEELEIAVVEAPKNITFATEKRYQMPAETIGVSQGFQRYHPGVDMRALLGSEIKPIADGVVLEVYRSLYGYGQSVIIEHANGVSSMYAHVMKIAVENGSDVDQNSVIARIGMTGQTTGPHLHLEIYKNGKVTNPQPYLDY